MADSEAGTAPSDVAAPGDPGTTAPAASSPDPNDFDARLRTDPEFAVSEFKKQQSAASKANDTLRKARLAIQIAEQVGGGDLEAGGQVALSEIYEYRQAKNDPKLAAVLQAWKNGEPLERAIQPPDEYEDPRLRQLTELTGTVARLENKLARNDIDKQFETFMQGDFGRALAPEEKTQAFNEIERSFNVLSGTPQGRKQLENLNAATLRTMAIAGLTDAQLFEIGERTARAKAEQLRQRGTDVPSRVEGRGGSVSDELPANVTALEALRAAKRRFGAT